MTLRTSTFLLALCLTPAFGAESAEAKGPLAGLLSAPGPHIEKLKALGEDAWLDLGKPAPDPKWGMGYGRSYLPNLAWAPDLKGAFICGPGVHGRTHQYPDGTTRYENDVWVYDLMGHRWVCVYPGLDVAKATFKLDAKGGVSTDDGHFMIRWHAYQQFCYDPGTRRFAIAGTVNTTDYLPARIRDEWGKVAKRVKYWAPWTYDATADQWEQQHPAGASVPGRGFLTYSPKLKRILYWAGSLFEYDAAGNAWIEHKVQNTAKVGYSICAYDTKRDRILIAGDGPGGAKRGADGVLAALDCGGGEIKALNSAGLAGFGGNDWMSGACITYDQAADALVLVQYTNPFKNLPDGKVGLHVYDCAADKWLPAKTLDAAKPSGCWSGFYAPELNVHVYHESGDSGPTRRVLAYRYRRAAGN